MTTKTKEEVKLSTTERRDLAGAGAAAMIGVLLAACGDDTDPPASTTTTTSSTGDPTSTSSTGGAADNDIVPLNALLSAEYNAITAYTAGAGLIDAAEAADPLFALKDVIKAVAVSFQAQHKLHAEALAAKIVGLKGEPVLEADIADMFVPPPELVANPSITNVLKFATSAERAAAIAYNQVIAGLEDASLRFLASSIEGDESQHFIVLAALVLGLAGPGANLSVATAGDVVPAAFVYTVGAAGGLDAAPPDYFP